MFTKFANPNFLRLSDKIYYPCFFTSMIFLVISLYFSFFASPPDYLQGETVRIMYVHVPCAWFSSLYLLIDVICSFISIVFKHTLADIVARACAPIGCMFYISNINYRFNMGKTNLGNLVGLGCEN